MKALLSVGVLKNLSALIVLQAGTYLAPLLLVPYLIRVIGMDLFGAWMFTMAFVVIARIFVNYGFDLTATRQVASEAKGSPHKLGELLVDITSARIIIWAAISALMLASSLFLKQLGDIRPLLICALFILVGEALFPAWLFQGMETMGAITLLRLGAKMLNLALVFIFVKAPGDLLLVPLLEAATGIASSLMALALVRKRFSPPLMRPQIARIKAQFREGWHTFVATLATQFYTTVNLIVLGFLVGPAAVGSYSLAEKIYSALRGLLAPFVQAIFPAMARLHRESRSQFTENYRNVLLYLAPLLCLIASALYFAAEPLITLASGRHEATAVGALQVFAISFPFAIGTFLSPMLVVRRRNATLMRITLIGGGIGLVLSPLLVNFYGVIGAVTVFLIVQIYNSIALVLANRISE